MKKTSQNITENCLCYEDIQLKLYLEIAKTGNYLLVAKNKHATEKQCIEAWEGIVQKNAEVNDSTVHNAYKDLEEEYAILLQKFQVIRAQILLLYCKVDLPTIAELKQERYTIDPYSGDEKYLEDLTNAMDKSQNMIGEVQRKYGEITELIGSGAQDPSLAELLSPLRFFYGYHIPLDILLMEYNDMKRYIREQKPNGRGTGRDNNEETGSSTS